jgi:hypothetical protein
MCGDRIIRRAENKSVRTGTRLTTSAALLPRCTCGGRIVTRPHQASEDARRRGRGSGVTRPRARAKPHLDGNVDDEAIVVQEAGGRVQHLRRWRDSVVAHRDLVAIVLVHVVGVSLQILPLALPGDDGRTVLGPEHTLLQSTGSCGAPISLASDRS